MTPTAETRASWQMASVGQHYNKGSDLVCVFFPNRPWTITFTAEKAMQHTRSGPLC